MKRLFAFTVAIMFLFITNAAAAPTIEIKSAVEDIITISGKTEGRYEVSLMILNPGYNNEDVLTMPDEAIAYFRTQRATNEGLYSFDVKMINRGGINGGEYTVILSCDEEGALPSFEFYFRETKASLIGEINTSTWQDIKEKLSNYMSIYSLSGEELTNANAEDIAKALVSVRDSLPAKSYPVDVDAMYSYFRQALLIGAYNSGDASLALKDGKLSYIDILGVTASGEYNDYLESLSAAGRGALNAALLSGAYKTIDEISEKFNQLVYLNVLTNYKDNGFGHVKNFFDKYRNVYISAGFELSRIPSVSNINNVYSKVASSNAATLKALAAEFNDALNSGGGGTGSTGKVPTNPGTGYVTETPPPIVDPPVVEPPKPEGFTDMGLVPWAEEAVNALKEKGVVSGRGDGIFAPNDSVTRAEFVKMVVGAFKISQGDEKLAFTDLNDGWSEPYIRAAVSGGIINGISETEFAPQMMITREQGAAILYRTILLKDKILENDADIFADDINISDYAKDAVYALKTAGVISGRDTGEFSPRDTMTRAEAAKMIYGAMNLTGGTDE